MAFFKTNTTYETPRPSLVADFANSKRMHPAFRFTRSGSARYHGPDGAMMEAKNNQPRFDHGIPTYYQEAGQAQLTGNPGANEQARITDGNYTSKGVLLEGASTNLLTYSNDFGGGFSSGGSNPPTAGTTTAPPGLYPGQSCAYVTWAAGTYATSYGGSRAIGNSFNFSQNVPQTRSFYIRLNRQLTGDESIFVYHTGSYASHSLGTINANNSDMFYDRWVRVILTDTVTIGNGSAYLTVFLNNATINSDLTVYFANGQVENNVSTATSYIHTEASAQTRQAENLYLPRMRQQSWFNPRDWSFVCDYYTNQPAPGSASRIMYDGRDPTYLNMLGENQSASIGAFNGGTSSLLDTNDPRHPYSQSTNDLKYRDKRQFAFRCFTHEATTGNIGEGDQVSLNGIVSSRARTGLNSTKSWHNPSEIYFFPPVSVAGQASVRMGHLSYFAYYPFAITEDALGELTR